MSKPPALHGKMALPVILVHPPAVSKRYLPTKFLPYGMAVIYSFLKEHEVPVIQNDFLMEYLFDAPEERRLPQPRKDFLSRWFPRFSSRRGSPPGTGVFH